MEVIARSPYVAYKTRSYKEVEAKALAGSEKDIIRSYCSLDYCGIFYLNGWLECGACSCDRPQVSRATVTFDWKESGVHHRGPDYQREKWGGVSEEIV